MGEAGGGVQAVTEAKGGLFLLPSPTVVLGMGMVGLKSASIDVAEAIQLLLGRCGPGEAGKRQGFGRRSLRRTVGLG